MADTKKEHYVPRCYLENFEGANNRIQVFDKAILQKRSQLKGEIASENYFYDIDFEKMIEGLESSEQEKVKKDLKEIAGTDDWEEIQNNILNKKHIEKDFLCRIEGIYAPLLKNIIAKSYDGNKWVIDNCAPFSEEEKTLLALFIAIQMIRTKATREEIGEIIEKTYQTLLYKQQMKIPDPLPKEAFQVQASEEFIKLQHSAMLLDEDNAVETAEILLNHIWVVYVNKTDTPFYTSDNPIVRIPNKRDKYMTHSGLTSEGIEIAFPISPKLLLVMYDKKWFSKFFRDRTFIEITSAVDVEEYNKHQVVHSYRCVYSQQNNFDMAESLCKKYPQIRAVGNRVEVG